MSKLLTPMAGAFALGLPLLVAAHALRSDPADPTSPAPPLRYQSAFADYKPYQDIKPADWRALNDAVRGATSDASGDAGHVMVAPAASAASAPVSAASAASMPGHSGHQMHGDKK